METESFQQYLTSRFQMKIENDRHYFLLIPGTQCPGCVFFNGASLPDSVNDQLTVITIIRPDRTVNFSHLLRDTTGELETLPLVEYANKLLVTENGRIQSIHAVYDLNRQLDSLAAVDKS